MAYSIGKGIAPSAPGASLVSKRLKKKRAIHVIETNLEHSVFKLLHFACDPVPIFHHDRVGLVTWQDGFCKKKRLS
jgi:hypothetical protein